MVDQVNMTDAILWGKDGRRHGQRMELTVAVIL